MLNLLWPWLLITLPLPWLMRRLLPAAPDSGAIILPPGVLPHGAMASGHRGRWPWLALAAWLCLVIASSRPVWLGDPVALPAHGRDIVLAIDLSGSMDERDVQFRGRRVQRLAVVQAVAGEFISGRQGDRIGLVLFGENAYLQSPLSLDRDTTRQLLDEAEVGLAGQKTAIGDALGLSVKHLIEAGRNEDRVVVLLTDGENNAGRLSPDKAAELAAQSGVRVHAIGFSGEARGGGLFGVMRGGGIDERALRRIAEATGGRVFTATSVGALEQIYTLLDEIEPVEVETLSFRPRRELFHWPLGLMLALIGLHLLRSLRP